MELKGWRKPGQMEQDLEEVGRASGSCILGWSLGGLRDLVFQVSFPQSKPHEMIQEPVGRDRREWGAGQQLELYTVTG